MQSKVYVPVKVYNDGKIDELMDCIQTNEKHMNEIEKAAIAKGGLLHRFIYEPVADGKAIYQIVRVNKRTVNIKLCSLDGKYADYIVPYWGESASIDKTYAEMAIKNQDVLRELIASRK
jgi:hypothetical protein